MILMAILAAGCTASDIEYELGCEDGAAMGTGYKCQSYEDAEDAIEDLDLDLGQPYSAGLYRCFWAAYDALDDSEVCR